MSVAKFTIKDLQDAQNLVRHLEQECEHLKDRLVVIKVEQELIGTTIKVMRATMNICKGCDGGAKRFDCGPCPSCMGTGLHTSHKPKK
jgi:DnaJ-class molecular chaperone